MFASALLTIALTAGATCSKPVLNQTEGNFITPGVFGDVIYKDGLGLDAYAPEGAPRSAVVLIHGSYGNKRTHFTQLFEPLARAGVNWFSIDYRTLQDVEDAIRFIRCPGRFNITNEMFAIGEDSGGQIALELAASGTVHGAAIFGVKLSPQFAATLSGDHPSRPTHRSDASVLMFHGTDDEEAPFARAQALCNQMSHCILHAVTGGIHQFENWHPDQWSWKEDLIAWLRGDRRGVWKDIVYARPGGRELLMDAYIPNGSGPFPAAIVIHGGGWEAGDKVTYIAPIFEPLARAQIAWFSIDYRLTPYVRVSNQLDDVRSAIRYVRQHADRFHIDPNRLALIGESASGHLVTQVASQPCTDCEVQAVVSFYGVYDFTHWAMGEERQRRTLKRLFDDNTPEAIAQFSPIENVNSRLPPMLLFQGTRDELYQGTLDYVARLKKTGVRHELIMLDGAPHGMENWEGHPEWMFYKQKLTDWLWTVFNRR